MSKAKDSEKVFVCVCAHVLLRHISSIGGSDDHISEDNNQILVYRFSTQLKYGAHVNTCRSVCEVPLAVLNIYTHIFAFAEWMAQCAVAAVVVVVTETYGLYHGALIERELSNRRHILHGSHTVCECSHEQKQKAEAQQ